MLSFDHDAIQAVTLIFRLFQVNQVAGFSSLDGVTPNVGS